MVRLNATIECLAREKRPPIQGAVPRTPETSAEKDASGGLIVYTGSAAEKLKPQNSKLKNLNLET